MVITSKDNETIKKIRKLKEKKYRDIDKKYIIEGVKLIKEAIEEIAEIDTIVVCENCVQTGEIDSKTLYEIAKYNSIHLRHHHNRKYQIHNGILQYLKQIKNDGSRQQ